MCTWNSFDVVVIGAGQGGLAASYGLAQSGIEHVVLEKNRIGETWRSQRWDSFCANTPNWSNNLAGLDLEPHAPDAFPHRDELVGYLERYAAHFNLPVRENCAVTRVNLASDSKFSVKLIDELILARAVIMATGGLSRPRRPHISQNISAEVLQLTAGDYRNAKDLPEGAILVIGSGQSGCQIAEDLLDGGREVYLCTSRVGRVPRAYRGRDFMAWWDDMGLWDKRIEDLDDPHLPQVTHPQVSGNDSGHTLSLQLLAKKGAVLLGRLSDALGSELRIAGDLLENIRFGDEKSDFYKRGIDQFIRDNELAAPPPENDPGEPPLPHLKGSEHIDRLDLKARGIASLIWCGGFDADWRALDPRLLDEQGQPRYKSGIGACEGLYFVGMPWLHTRKSGILYGVSEDAERVVAHIEQQC